MSDIFQKQHNIKFGIEIEMISPLEEDDFIKVFNATAQQFLLPIRVDYEDNAPQNFWKIKGDGSITFLSKNISAEAYPTKIPREKFPSHKIISQASGVGYRPGEQMFFPIKPEEQVSEAKLIDRKPSFKIGDEEIKFRKSESSSRIELISPPLPFDDIHIDQVKWVINILKRMRMKVNASTGIHVHVSFNELDLFNFTKLLKNVDEKKIKELWPTRFNTTYTRKKDDVVDVVKKYFSNLFDKYMSNDEDEERSINNASINNILAVANNVFERYYGINIKAFTLHGTIEFRYAGAELKDKKVVDWLRYIRALIEQSLKQDKVKIGDFEITSTNGILSITSDLHPGEVLTSNSIIDQFSFKENANKSIKQFLQEKNLLDNKEEIFKQINEYPYHVTVKQPHLKTKIKALEGFMTFIKAVVREGVISVSALDQNMRDRFNDVLQAYVAKELINSGVAEFSNFVNYSVDTTLSNKTNYILDNIDNKAISRIPADGVKYIIKSYAKNNEDEELMLFLKKLDSDKVDSAISSFESGSDVAVSITFALANTKSIDNMEDTVGIKISDDTLLKVFSKENLNKILNSVHDASTVEAFLVRSFSPLSTKILEDNFIFAITDNTSISYHAQSVVSAFNEILSGDHDFNKKNLDILVTKLKSILPETVSGRLEVYVNTIEFNNKLVNDKLTYDDVVSKYDADAYSIVNSQQNNYIVKTKNKLGIFAIILSMSNQKQVKQFLDNDSKLKEEVNILLKRFVKTADISGSDVLNIIVSSVDFYGFNDLLKQEYFNRIKLSQEEFNDFLSNVSNTDAIETKYLEIFDLLLGVESNKKLFVKNIPFELIVNREYNNKNFIDYATKTLKVFANEIDYDDLAKEVFQQLFSATYSRYSSKENSFIKSITDPEYASFINIPRFKDSMRKEVHKHFNDFISYVIDNLINENFKPNLRELVDIFQIQNPMIDYLINDKEDDDKLKSAIVGINNGDVLSSIILEKMLKGITNYGLGSVEILNHIKSQTLLLQVVSFGVNKNVSIGNLALWLSKFFGLKDKIPDVNFLDKVYSISTNLLTGFLQRVGSGWSDYKLQKYIAENYEELKKSPFFKDVQTYWIDEISIQEKIVKSGFTTVKWKKTYDKLQNEDERKGISNTNIRVIGNKSSITFIVNSQKFQSYKYENTYTLISKDFHEQEKTATERPPNTNNAVAYLSVFEDRVPDLLTTSQWKSLQLIIKLVMKNIEETYGFEKSGSDTIRFEKDKQLSLFPEEDKEEVKPEEETVKEEIDYSKKFKEIMLTEGVKKAKVFLKKNKNNITDRKLTSVIKRMGI